MAVTAWSAPTANAHNAIRASSAMRLPGVWVTTDEATPWTAAGIGDDGTGANDGGTMGKRWSQGSSQLVVLCHSWV